MGTPLDVAGHVAMMRRTLANVRDRSQLAPLLGEILGYAGISDIASLMKRQEQGLSVYGVVPAYPVGTQADLAGAIASLKAVTLEEVSVPTGTPIVPGEGWEIPEADISLEALATLSFGDLQYVPPLA